MFAGQLAAEGHEAAAVVGDRQVHAVLAEPQLDVHPRGGARVFDRVGQRFDADAEQVVLERGVERPRRAA